MNYSNFSLPKLQSLINLTTARLARAVPGSTEAAETKAHLDVLWSAATEKGLRAARSL